MPAPDAKRALMLLDMGSHETVAGKEKEWEPRRWGVGANCLGV